MDGCPVQLSLVYFGIYRELGMYYTFCDIATLAVRELPLLANMAV